MDFQESQARRMITRHMWLAMGAGLVPLSFLNSPLLVGIQLRLLRQLSRNYQVPFFQDCGKKMISALLGTIVPAALTQGLVALTGPVLGGLSMSIFAGATTYAIGKIFLQHFESGGTFLDLEPATVREYFRQEFEKGQTFARQMRHTSGVPSVPELLTSPPGHGDPS